MPIYAYACKQCDHTLDALQKIADAPLVDCPSCGELDTIGWRTPDARLAISPPVDTSPGTPAQSPGADSQPGPVQVDGPAKQLPGAHATALH